MKWVKISLATTTEAVDMVSNMLDELGVEGIQIEDNIPISEEDKKAMYIDILPELQPDDGTAVISSYLSTETDINSLVSDIKAGLDELSSFMNIGEGSITLSEADDKDWIDNWKEFFKPFRVAEDIIIKPTWEKLEDVNDNNLIIEIDPGTAFGTGSHETTKLCIEGLRKYVGEETKLLDIGCGSGILSIIGIKLGAKYTVATDIDPAALSATEENIKTNKISKERFRLVSGNIIEDISVQQDIGYSEYDIVAANILADVIIPLCKQIGKHMKQNGLFISSGIIFNKKEEVREAIQSNGFEIIEENQIGDWVSFIAKKNGDS